MSQKEKGQYFTVSEQLQQFVFDHVKYKMAHLLEPSFGAGHLLKKFLESNPAYPMTCYELDATIEPIVALVGPAQQVIYADFLQQLLHTQGTFQTIVANPPYVKMAKGHNLYVTFIQRCFDLLTPNGEMVFIVPSDFLKVTSAAPMIDAMTAAGSFTDFWFPHDETLFVGANIDVVVFRYEKGLHQPTCVVNDQIMYCRVRKGIITFSADDDSLAGLVPLSDHFQVYVGLVSGRDSIYNVSFGNMKMLQDKDSVTTWIFTTEFPTTDMQINTHLLAHKEALLDRKIKVFSEKNWFEWGAPRNIKSIQKHWGTPCLYVRNMTRHKDVAFVDTVQYFGGALLCLVPKNPAAMTIPQLHRVAQFLNGETFRANYTYSQRFKIGQKQLENAMILCPLDKSKDIMDMDMDMEEYTDDTMMIEEYTLAAAPAAVEAVVEAVAPAVAVEAAVEAEEVEEYELVDDEYEMTVSGVKESLQEIMPNIMTFFLKKEHDGRSQSANLEQQVLTTIKDHLLGKYPSWMIETTRAREFYDIKINGIHINLKLTAGKSADNSASKKGIYYSITGQETYKSNSTWNNFFEHLQQAKATGHFKQVRDKSSEYHYLVIHKNKKDGNVIFKPIFDIHTYKSNPSNDLQIHWGNEFDHAAYVTTDGEYKHKVESLLQTLQKSCLGYEASQNIFSHADLKAAFFT